MDLVKQWLLVVGLVLAAVIAFVPQFPYPGQVMIVLGLILGWFCVSDSNATSFLIAALALIGAGMSLNVLAFIGTHIGTVISAFNSFLGAAAFLVAFRSLYNTARG